METDVNWRYTAVAVTKYNPTHRDENGYYTKDDWTSYSDVGNIYDGELFTMEMYLETEQKYLAAAKLFFEFHNCLGVLVKSVEKPTIDVDPFRDLKEANFVRNKIANNDIISLSELGTVVRLILRGYLWCELFCDQSPDTAVRFGHDYYMYFNSPRLMSKVFSIIEDMGLFIS